MDLIDRQAAIDAIEKNACNTQRIMDAVNNLPSAQPERSTEPCEFCRDHEKGDTLYESSTWDGGIGFDYIDNIKFCPICGRELQDG